MPPAAGPPDISGLIAAGGLAYVDDRLDEARVHWEQAFRLLREAGASAGAARVATLLGELHWGGLGHPSIGRGWLERAHRLLDEAGPCVEWGYWELARLACDRPDVLALQHSAERALGIAAEFGDVALHTRALADSGFALVTQGRFADGFARLEEALAVISSGEVTDPFAVSTSCCALLSACDRAGDRERAIEWLQVVHEVVLGPAEGRPRMLGAHCQLALGGVLCSAGRWPEAEQAIRQPLDPASGATNAQRIEATSRLAELCIHAGRVDEAEELIASIEDHHSAAWPRALILLSRGEPRLAAAAARRGLDALVGEALRRAALLSLIVEAELACDDRGSAIAAAASLREVAQVADAPVVEGLAALADARVAAARGAAAEALLRLEQARKAFLAAGQPLHVAQVQLALAESLGGTAPDDAVTAARAAHAAAVRLGADQLRDRSAAVLRAYGVTPPRAVPARTALKELSPRETEILDGLRRGETNAVIAARLFLSAKTVERHVSNLFVKLGVRSRAEAAALAASAKALRPQPDEPT